MTTERLIPNSSQTVGPYFRIGLDYLIDRTSTDDATTLGTIAIRGRVLDRDGVAVPDAMLEFWSVPHNFRRAATDLDGNFCVMMGRPVAVRMEDGRTQSPHLLVLVFARGLLRHLISRVYFESEPGNESDPVLLGVPADRRRTLMARRDGDNSFRWDVTLQGPDETVFFAW